MSLVITISKRRLTGRAVNKWNSLSSAASWRKRVKISRARRAYSRGFATASWAWRSLLAATICMARVICFMFLVEPMRRLICCRLAIYVLLLSLSGLFVADKRVGDFFGCSQNFLFNFFGRLCTG